MRQNWIVESESDPRVDVAFVFVDRRLLSAHDERYNANTINTIVDMVMTAAAMWQP